MFLKYLYTKCFVIVFKVCLHCCYSLFYRDLRTIFHAVLFLLHCMDHPLFKILGNASRSPLVPPPTASLRNNKKGANGFYL